MIPVVDGDLGTISKLSSETAAGAENLNNNQDRKEISMLKK